MLKPFTEAEVADMAKQMSEHFRTIRSDETPRDYAAAVAQEAIMTFARLNGWMIYPNERHLSRPAAPE